MPKLITESIQAASTNTKITICIILIGGVACCAVYDSTLPKEQQSTFVRRVQEIIDKYISQRNKELIKKVALTPVAVVGGGVQGALFGVWTLYVAGAMIALPPAPFAGALSALAPGLAASAAGTVLWAWSWASIS